MFRKFLSAEDGVETVEYGIIVGLIVAGALAAISALSFWVNNAFTAFQTEVGA